jgi:hypothetical protein
MLLTFRHRLSHHYDMTSRIFCTVPMRSTAGQYKVLPDHTWILKAGLSRRSHLGLFGVAGGLAHT